MDSDLLFNYNNNKGSTNPKLCNFGLLFFCLFWCITQQNSNKSPESFIYNKNKDEGIYDHFGETVRLADGIVNILGFNNPVKFGEVVYFKRIKTKKKYYYGI
jgi:hypothetical protein